MTVISQREGGPGGSKKKGRRGDGGREEAGRKKKEESRERGEGEKKKKAEGRGSERKNGISKGQEAVSDVVRLVAVMLRKQDHREGLRPKERKKKSEGWRAREKEPQHCPLIPPASGVRPQSSAGSRQR